MLRSKFLWTGFWSHPCPSQVWKILLCRQTEFWEGGRNLLSLFGNYGFPCFWIDTMMNFRLTGQSLLLQEGLVHSIKMLSNTGMSLSKRMLLTKVSRSIISTAWMRADFHPLIQVLSMLSTISSAWKSGPVWSFVKFWQDWDLDQSSQVNKPQKTGLNRCQPVQCGFRWFSTVERPVSTSLYRGLGGR